MPQLNPVAAGAGPQPPGPPVLNIIDYIRQFTDWRFKTPLTPDDYFWRVEQVLAQLGTSATTNTATYTPPANYNGLIFGVHAILSFQQITLETLSVTAAGGATGVGNISLVDRILMKAMNTLVDLQNVGRTQKLFGTNSKPLSDLLSVVGGQPIAWPIPYVLPDGEQLQMDLKMQDTTAAVVGGNYQAGLGLNCLFVKTRP